MNKKVIAILTLFALLFLGFYLLRDNGKEESDAKKINSEYEHLEYVAGEVYGAVNFYSLFEDKIKYSYQVDDWVKNNKDKYIYLGSQWDIVDVNNINEEKEILVSYSTINDLFEKDENIKRNSIKNINLIGCKNDLWKLDDPDVDEFILVIKITNFIKNAHPDDDLLLGDNEFTLKGECIEIIGGETGY